MTLFAVWAKDGKDRLAVRERVRAEHRARLRAPAPHRVTVRAAGPLLDPATQAMTGTLLVIEADDIEAVQAFVDADPYVREGVYARVAIHPFVCGLGPWEQGAARAAPE